MIKIEEHMKLSKIERQAHIKLDEPCIERGGYMTHGTNSYMVKGLLAHILNTTIPVKYTLAGCLHACGNGKCSNPNHLYWGNHSENMQDLKEHRPNLTSAWERTVAKHGLEKARAMRSMSGKKSLGKKRPEHSIRMLGNQNARKLATR